MVTLRRRSALLTSTALGGLLCVGAPFLTGFDGYDAKACAFDGRVIVSCNEDPDGPSEFILLYDPVPDNDSLIEELFIFNDFE